MASVLTGKGRDVMTGRMVGATPTQAEPKVLAWGAPSAQFTAAASDVGLFAETPEARVTGASSVVTTTTASDTYQAVGTLTASAARAVTEVALVDSATKPYATTVTGGTAVGSAVGATLTVAAAFTPANGTLIQVRTEVMLVTAGTGTTNLTVTRGQNGSAAIATIAAADVVTAGNPPGSAAIVGGTVAAHYDFAVINLGIGDTLQSTCQVKVT